MTARSALQVPERHDEDAPGELPYAPLAMPRQQLEPDSRLRDIVGRMIRLSLFSAQREH